MDFDFDSRCKLLNLEVYIASVIYHHFSPYNYSYYLITIIRITMK
jgi:hypothetical protein